MRKLRNLAAILGVLLLSWLVMPASMQTTIANNAADMSGKIVMVADSATGRTVTNLFTFDRGAAVPFAVGASSLKVTNLDADKLDGLDSVRYKQAVVTTTSTGTQNNFDPSGAIAAGNQIVLIRCNNAADLTVTGLVTGIDGQIVIFYDIGSFNVLFQDASGGAGSTVELQNIATSAATPISTRGFAKYVYDSTSTIWRLTAHEQGAWITPTYAGGSYTANGAMTWTVDSGDVTTQAYRLNGRTLTVNFSLGTTSVAGVVSTALQIGNAAWGGYTSTKQVLGGNAAFADSGGVTTAGIWQSFAAGTGISIFKSPVANWTAAVNTTSVHGSATFEVN